MKFKSNNVKRLGVLLSLLLSPGFLLAQVSLNADGTGRFEPHPASAIEIQSSDKGVLIPRLSQAERLDMPIDSAAEGLLVYQKDGNIGFYLVQAGQWTFLNPILLPDDGKEESFSFAKVAYSGDYNDLINRPTLPTPPSGDTMTLARVALTGDYNDLRNKPTIPESVSDIAAVAFTGDYNDLTNKPFIPISLRDLVQDSLHRTVSASQRERWDAGAARTIPFALTDYETDVLHGTVSYLEQHTWDESAARNIPTRLSELKEDEYAQTVSDTDIARWDSAAARSIPTALRDLAQDNLHRTISETQRERWQAHAQDPIPSTVADFESDDYYLPISLSERRAWDRQAATPVPTRLSELKEDEYAQTVSDADIARWNQAAARIIPTALREFSQDSLHRTITTQQLNRWTTHAEAMFFSGNYADLNDLPEIPRHISQFTDDDLHKIISYKERESWEAAYARKVPTRLAELTDDNMDYRLISDAEKRRWDSMAVRDIPEYDDNDRNAFILHGNPEYMENYRALSSFGRQGTWSSLQGRPTFSPNTAPVTGNYADLAVQSLPKLQAVESGFLNTLSYNDLLYDKPALEKAFVESGESRHLGEKPEMLSDFAGTEGATHLAANDVKNYRTAYDKLLTTGLSTPSEYTLNDVHGTYTNLRLAEKLSLEGTPTITGTFPSAATVRNSTTYDNHLATVQIAKALDALTIEEATGKREIIPEGTVMMWTGNDFPAGRDANGGCWKKFGALENRFPVGAKISDKGIYGLGDAGGETAVTLTIDQMPRHNHRVMLQRSTTKPQSDNQKHALKGKDTPEPTSFDSYADRGAISYNSLSLSESSAYPENDPLGAVGYTTAAHNNLPPYYVINFIVYTKTGCPAQ